MFQGMLGKTAALKVLGNSKKNAFSSVPFKEFELFNPPTYNSTVTENWLHRKCLLSVFP